MASHVIHALNRCGLQANLVVQQQVYIPLHHLVLLMKMGF